MNTQIAPTTDARQLDEAVEAAVLLLNAGFSVALPTETVYGLAGAAMNKEALLRIFQSKERPFFNPLIVHLPSADWLDRVCVVSEEDRSLVARLSATFWPGPLTIVLPRKGSVPDLATSGLPTVAVRVSAHPVFQRVITAFDQPLAAPSANRFGRISPTAAAHVMAELDGRIHLIVDGGPTMHGIESTVVSVRGDSMWILRDGPVSAEQLKPFGKVGTGTAMPAQRPVAPGQLKSHYSPETRMLLLKPGVPPKIERPEPWGLLAFRTAENMGPYKHIEVLSESGDLREAAATLFAKLRALDAMCLQQIVAEPVPETGLGVAIMDRLRKAAGNA